jgi:hypothetical protein
VRVTVRVSSVTMFYGKYGAESVYHLSLRRHKSNS